MSLELRCAVSAQTRRDWVLEFLSALPAHGAPLCLVGDDTDIAAFVDWCEARTARRVECCTLTQWGARLAEQRDGLRRASELELLEVASRCLDWQPRDGVARAQERSARLVDQLRALREEGALADQSEAWQRAHASHLEQLAQRGLVDDAECLRYACSSDEPLHAVLVFELLPRTSLERHAIEHALGLAEHTCWIAAPTVELEALADTGAITLLREPQTAATVPQPAPVSALSVHDEVERAVRAVLHARRQGVALERMAVVLPDDGPEHAAAVVPVLERAELPWFSTLPERRVLPAGRALLVLVQCAAEACSAERLGEFFSLGEASAALSCGWSPHAERVLVDAAVLAGADRWAARLDVHELALRRDGENESAEPMSPRQRDRAVVRALREAIVPLVEQLASMPAVAPWHRWRSTLQELATFALASPEAVHEALGSLRWMPDELELELADLVELLHQPLTFSYEGPTAHRAMALPASAWRRSSRHAALRIGVAAQLSGAELEHVFVVASHTQSEHARRACEGAARVALWRSVVAPASAHDFDFDLADALDPRDHGRMHLRGLMRREELETRGAARALLEGNPWLGRSLRQRAERWNAKRWYPADGLLIASEAGRTALSAHHLAMRAYSPTGLQHFAACPYRFYLQAIARLSPRKRMEPTLDLPALERGSLVHSIQFEFLLTLRTRGWLPLTPDQHADARALLVTIADRCIERARLGLAPLLESVWNAQMVELRADVQQWWQRTLADAEYTPAFFELSFGLPGQGEERDPRSQDEPVRLDGGLQLRGSIDLVERHRDGHYRATDYKTGKLRAAAGDDLIKGGTLLQPVLYALVLERLLAHEQPPPRIEGGRLFYCSQRAGFESVGMPLDDEARGAARLLTEALDCALEVGFLPAVPAKDECSYCDYRVVCGADEERRSAVKPGGRPEKLAVERASSSPLAAALVKLGGLRRHR